MTHVWIVEKGAYSDRRVLAVCSTHTKAESVVAMLGGESRCMPIDVVDQRAGLRWFGVTVDERGRVGEDAAFHYVDHIDTRDRVWMGCQWKDDADLPPEKRGGSGEGGRRKVALGDIKHDAWKVLRVWVWARSLQHAQTYAQDLRRQLIASGRWDATQVSLGGDTELMV